MGIMLSRISSSGRSAITWSIKRSPSARSCLVACGCACLMLLRVAALLCSPTVCITIFIVSLVCSASSILMTSSRVAGVWLGSCAEAEVNQHTVRQTIKNIFNLIALFSVRSHTLEHRMKTFLPPSTCDHGHSRQGGDNPDILDPAHAL